MARSSGDFNQDLIEHFRANGGQIKAGPFAGRALLLMGTIGKRSGQPRTNPLVYSRDGERYVVVASKGGAPTSPDWYYNLLARPRVTVEVGSERFEAAASVAQGAERDRLYEQHARLMPVFREYQQRTSRRIPVVLLERVS